MKVLVTGGAGFIGSHVAEYYARKGDEVIVFENLMRNELLGKKIGDPLYSWKYLSQYGNVKLVNGDVRCFEALLEVAKGVKAIIHTAAQVAVTSSIMNPKIDFEINALGTFNLLEAARLEDASLIFTSTNKVYGENVNKIAVIGKGTRYQCADPNFKEGIPKTFPLDLTVHNPYSYSKLSADIYIQDYAHSCGPKTGVFRTSCVYCCVARIHDQHGHGWASPRSYAIALMNPL